MEIAKKFRVEMAHRVSDAYTKECRGLHGHSYVIELTISDIDGNRGDMIVDFKLVKDIVKPVIDSMDHAIMIHDKDTVLVQLAPVLNPKYLIVPFNPTAENMAEWIYKQIAPLFENFRLAKVTVHETESAYAVYSFEDENIERINDRKDDVLDIVKDAVARNRNGLRNALYSSELH